MPEPFVGELKMFAGNYAPYGWKFCDGSRLPISEYETLFTLIGTTYGGDGQSTFQLPDLRGRVPVHQGRGTDGITYILGETGGVESVTVTTQQMPRHNHIMFATTSAAALPNVANALPATGTLSQLYWGDPPDQAAAPQAIGPMGDSRPHSNLQPYLCVNFIISMFGIFPPQG